MFKTELTIEEEEILKGVLDGDSLTRIETLHRINSLDYNVPKNISKIFKSTCKSLFEKIQNTSDFEFDEYSKLLNIPEE